MLSAGQVCSTKVYDDDDDDDDDDAGAIVCQSTINLVFYRQMT